MNAYWLIEKVSGGHRLTLIGGNGEEIVRAMTIYNEEDDAERAIELAQATATIRYKGGGPTDG